MSSNTQEKIVDGNSKCSSQDPHKLKLGFPESVWDNGVSRDRIIGYLGLAKLHEYGPCESPTLAGFNIHQLMSYVGFPGVEQGALAATKS